MAIGEKMATARKRQGLTQEDVSTMINYSRESVAKYETGNRKVPKHLYSTVTQTIDDPEFYFETWGETTGYVSIPFFNGDHVDHHPASMRHLVQAETNEALAHIEQVCWHKPVHSRTAEEREEIKSAILEVLDAAASMINLVAILCREYNFSMKDIFRAWQVTLKARKYKK